MIQFLSWFPTYLSIYLSDHICSVLRVRMAMSRGPSRESKTRRWAFLSFNSFSGSQVIFITVYFSVQRWQCSWSYFLLHVLIFFKLLLSSVLEVLFSGELDISGVKFVSNDFHIYQLSKAEEKKEEVVEEAEEERGERPRLVMMRRMESETTSYEWSTDSESLRSGSELNRPIIMTF